MRDSILFFCIVLHSVNARKLIFTCFPCSVANIDPAVLSKAKELEVAGVRAAEAGQVIEQFNPNKHYDKFSVYKDKEMKLFYVKNL